MAYELDQFISDCRSSLKRDPGAGGREQVRANLEKLLSNKTFVEKYCGDDVERVRDQRVVVIVRNGGRIRPCTA